MTRRQKTGIFMIIAACIVVIAIGMNPVIHPTSRSLIKHALTSQIKANSMRGRICITNDAILHFDSDNTASAITQAAISVRTDSEYAMDNDALKLNGSTDVAYSSLGKKTNYFVVFKSLDKKKQYVYYSGLKPGKNYLDDYESWAAIDTKKNTITNFPGSFRDMLLSLQKASFDKTDSGYIVTGTFPDKELAGLIRYFNQTDTKNTNLMRGLSFGKKAVNTAKLKFDNKRNLKNIDIRLSGVSAGTTDIKAITIKMTFEENKEKVSVPKTLSKEVLDTDFTVPLPQEDITLNLPGKIADSVKIRSLEDLNISYDGDKVDSLNDLQTYILASDDVESLSSDDENKEMVTTHLLSDPDAQFYFYTENGRLKQVACDSSYARKATIPVMINGLRMGADQATVKNILGEPTDSTTDNGVTTFNYLIGNGEYNLVLTFYQADDITNGGMQRINIIKEK